MKVRVTKCIVLPLNMHEWCSYVHINGEKAYIYGCNKNTPKGVMEHPLGSLTFTLPIAF